MKYTLVLFSLLVFHQVQAQYWFGPKVGVQRTDFKYQVPEYKEDSFDIKPNYNFQAGGVLVYQASDKYAIHAELIYERVRRKLTNRENDPVPVLSDIVFNYISVPFSLRWNFGADPFHVYVSGGPKLSYWLGGTGKVYLDEFAEFGDGEIRHYNVVFRQSKSGSDLTKMAVVEANRVQYSLQVATGVYFDLIEAGRIMLDLRYSFGHSNVGFNDNPDFQFDTYEENFRFRNNMLSVSVAYLFEYDVKGRTRGMSTIKESNKRRRH